MGAIRDSIVRPYARPLSAVGCRFTQAHIGKFALVNNSAIILKERPNDISAFAVIVTRVVNSTIALYGIDHILTIRAY